MIQSPFKGIQMAFEHILL